MNQVITSLQNTTVKLVAALHAKKQRDKLGLFIAEGIRLVEEAAAEWPLHCFVYSEKLLLQPRGVALISTLEEKGARGLLVSDAVYQKISLTESAQGILALIPKRATKMTDWNTEQLGCIAVLDEIQDPGNVGAIIRTAAAANCSAVVLTSGCADPFSDKAVRAAMGALFKIPVVENVAREELSAYCRENRIRLIATCLEGATSYEKLNYMGRNAIIFGNEGNGVHAELIKVSHDKIKIPLYHEVESLNVAAAAAVILYEVLRQKQSQIACNLQPDML